MKRSRKKAKPASGTPLTRQYDAIKAEHPDKILMFHLGDFYEMFGEDAEVASRALGITLTSRSKGEGSVPLAGFPVHAARAYIEKLLAAGHRVAICDQVEDPAKAKGIVKREVTRVLTPGTLLSDICGEGLLPPGENNYLAAVVRSAKGGGGGGGSEGVYGLAYVDLSTGEFAVSELGGAALVEELARIRPAEVLAPEGMVRDEEAPGYGLEGEGGKGKKDRKKEHRQDEPAEDDAEGGYTTTPYPDWAFDEETARRKLLDHFGVETLDAFGVEALKGKGDLATSAAGALIRYLEETHRSGLDHLKRLDVVSPSDFMAFDGEALRNLEILETIRERRKDGALLGVLDRTRTAPGARRLRQWIVRPLVSVEAIKRRQDAVAELVKEGPVRSRLRDALSEVQDMERIASKLAAGRVNGRDLLALAASIEVLPELARALEGARAEVLRALAAFFGEAAPLLVTAGEIRAELRPDPPATIRDGGVIADGVSEELDHLRQVRAGGKSWIAQFQAREIKRTGISSLKVGYNKVFGYYIEVTKANQGAVPEDYERKQTLVNAERFVTPELKEREVEVLGAEEKILALEYELFCSLRDRTASQLAGITEAGARVGDLDALSSLAEVASDRGYVRPEVDDSLVIEIEEGKHPVLEAMMAAGRYVPNDVMLDAERRQVVIVTGPNMAGKSTYIRSCALLVAMAQAGSFVPARRARVGVCDRIFARVGASDDLARGRSTFMVEMVDTARVLRTATRRSLVILDEVGRGTSTYDGVSIAWAVSEHLHEAPTLGCRTLFATHYHELCALSEELPRVANVSVAVKEWGDEITFLYRIVPGGADRSYGIHVARLAGVPDEVIDRARAILKMLESRSEAPVKEAKRRPGPEVEQLALFAPARKSDVEEALRKLDIEKLTPLEALVRLEELKRLLGGG